MNVLKKILLFSGIGTALFLLAPFLAPYDPMQTDTLNLCQSPSMKHWCGTDEVGRDILSRMLYGARVTVGIGMIATFLACMIGTMLGLLSGYYGNKTDLILNQITDIALAFPTLLLAIGITVILPPGFFSILLALSLASWGDFARLIRSQTLILKNAPFVMAAKVLGTSSWSICFRHILPNCFSLIVVSASLKLGSFMLAESGLSFLGLGLPPPNPTLGGMIAAGRDYLMTSPWIPLIPGILIAGIVLLANVLGEILQKKMDPKLK
jgi:peptide/nickel transport system permease protein